jgi:hypothetical protein
VTDARVERGGCERRVAPTKIESTEIPAKTCVSRSSASIRGGLARGAPCVNLIDFERAYLYSIGLWVVVFLDKANVILCASVLCPWMIDV